LNKKYEDIKIKINMMAIGRRSLLIFTMVLQSM